MRRPSRLCAVGCLVAAATALAQGGAPLPLPMRMDFHLSERDAGVALDAGAEEALPAPVPDAGVPPSAPTADAPLRRGSAPTLVTACPGCAAAPVLPVSGDLHAFERHTQGTPAHERAQGLLTHHRRSLSVLYAGTLAGVAAAVAGMFIIPRQYCSFEPSLGGFRVPTPGSQSCTYGALNIAIGSVGLGVAALSVGAYFFDRPTSSQLVDAVNAWNVAYPEAPFLPQDVKDLVHAPRSYGADGGQSEETTSTSG